MLKHNHEIMSVLHSTKIYNYKLDVYKYEGTLKCQY